MRWGSTYFDQVKPVADRKSFKARFRPTRRQVRSSMLQGESHSSARRPNMGSDDPFVLVKALGPVRRSPLHKIISLPDSTIALMDRLPSSATRRWELITIATAAGYTGLYAWPASVFPASWVWGAHGDALGNAFEFTWFGEALLRHQPFAFDHAIAIPFGDNLGAQPHEPVFFVIAVVLSAAIGAVAALNLISLGALPLSAWVMFKLANRVVGSPAAAFFAGTAFGCSSFTLINSRGEPTLVQAWIFPLLAWVLLALVARPSLGQVLLTTSAVVVASMVNFYFALFIGLAAITLAAIRLLVEVIDSGALPVRTLTACVATGILSVSVSAVVYVGTLGNLAQRAGSIHRSGTDLAVLAASPLDFVLPPRNNPWFGHPRQARFEERHKNTGDYVDLAEMEIPVPVLALAPIGIALLVWRRVRHGKELAALLAVMALGLWLTVPPTAIHWRRLWFLSLEWDVYKFAPQYRAFHRATVLVQLGAIPSAAAALAWIGRNHARVTTMLALAGAVAVLVENFGLPEDRALAVAAAPEYQWLSHRPGDYAIAEFPLLPEGAGGGNEYTYAFNQRYHKHALLNGHSSSTESESMREELRDLNRPGVAGKLRALGIKYVLWHPDIVDRVALFSQPYATSLQATRPKSGAFDLEARFPDRAEIWSVAAGPVTAFAFFGQGAGPVQSDGHTAARAVAGQASIDVFSTQTAEVSLQVICRSSPGTVASLTHGALSLGTWTASTGGTIVMRSQIHVDRGVTRLRLRASGGELSCDLPSLDL